MRHSFTMDRKLGMRLVWPLLGELIYVGGYMRLRPLRPNGSNRSDLRTEYEDRARLLQTLNVYKHRLSSAPPVPGPSGTRPWDRHHQLTSGFAPCRDAEGPHDRLTRD